MAKYDVFGVGNALVDIQARVEDSLLTELALDKGIMTLVDDQQQASVLGSLGGLPPQSLRGRFGGEYDRRSGGLWRPGRVRREGRR